MGTIGTWLDGGGGGPFMVPLFLLGILGLVIVAARIVSVVQRSRINTRPFIEKVISLAAAGNTESALALCVEHKAALPDLGLVLLRSRIADPDELHAIARAASLAHMSELRRREGWVPALVLIIILLGVAGAAANLSIALDAAAPGGPSTLPDAVRYAVRPLIASMLIAILLVAGHACAVEARARLLTRLEEFSARLVNAMSGRPDVRLGHRD